MDTTFDLNVDDIKEIEPGQAVIVTQSGEMSLKQIVPQKKFSACSFERIYFSRGNDLDIHKEREQLGKQLREQIMKSIDNDVEHSVFTYIPNTAELAYYGMVQGIREVSPIVRTEKVVWKDIKLRTFITEGNSRNDLAAHVYDITAGSLVPYVDNLVVIDDSIVRGTTLRESIIRILNRLHPKKIVIVSSAPQIRYPDFYGIDMPKISDFIAFQACVALIKERGMEQLLTDTYEACKKELQKTGDDVENPIRNIYAPFTPEELNVKMVELLRPSDVTTPVEMVFQSIEGLHKAIPNHPGDWYFTGNYPTPGGMRLVNQSFINFMESQK